MWHEYLRKLFLLKSSLSPSQTWFSLAAINKAQSFRVSSWVRLRCLHHDKNVTKNQDSTHSLDSEAHDLNPVEIFRAM